MKSLQELIRVDSDWLARYGGEEFLLVLPETALENAGRLGEGLRAHIAGKKFSYEGEPIAITASFGLVGLVAALRGSFYRKLLASILVASVAPLVAFALFLRGYVETRVEAGLAASSAGVANAVRRVVEDYAAVVREKSEGGAPTRLKDATLAWLRGVVGQEIHLYEGGVRTATSKPELFASGLLLPRLAGEVHRAVVVEGLPYLVRWERLGELRLPVAYARVDLAGRDPAVVALPLVAQEREAARGVERLLEMLLLATVLLTGALALVAAFVARSVARPVRELVPSPAARNSRPPWPSVRQLSGIRRTPGQTRRRVRVSP